MKKTYHLCLSSGNEVMFRDEEDYNRGFNSFALALYKTDSVGLVESFMSNHCHFVIQSHDPSAFMNAMRMSYVKYFNNKYCRTGSLGEKTHYELEIVGLYHHLAAMSYVLRNPLHHGVSPIPYAYPHSSVNAIFKKDMGKFHTEPSVPKKYFHRYIGKRAEFPDNYIMSESGVFLRESVLDVVQVENMFVTPRNFDYYMGRKTSEDWMKEQEKDSNAQRIVRLEDIEEGIVLQSLEKMLINESGRANYRKVSDIGLCQLIDRNIMPTYGKFSVYQLSADEKRNIARFIQEKYHISESQIIRCLVI